MDIKEDHFSWRALPAKKSLLWCSERGKKIVLGLGFLLKECKLVAYIISLGWRRRHHHHHNNKKKKPLLDNICKLVCCSFHKFVFKPVMGSGFLLIKICIRFCLFFFPLHYLFRTRQRGMQRVMNRNEVRYIKYDKFMASYTEDD